MGFSNKSGEELRMDFRDRKPLLPFSLGGAIIVLDQITKAFITANWPKQGAFIKDVFNNDFLIIYHVRNKAIAFSIGTNFSEPFRFIFFVIVPIVVLVFLVWYYFRSAEFSRLQRWAIAGIIGGGFGNIIDRVVRPDGVVDFISVKLYGLFGMERWPTFNVADSSVVICSILLLFTMIIPQKEEPKSSEEV